MPQLPESLGNRRCLLEHILLVLTGIRRNVLVQDSDSQMDSLLIRSEADSTII